MSIILSSDTGNTFKEIFIPSSAELKIPTRPQKWFNFSKWFMFLLFHNFGKLNIKLSLIRLLKVGIVVFDEKKYKISEDAKIIFDQKYDSTDKTQTDQELLLTWTHNIGDKQYRSYSWNDEKVQSLLTVDAALIAGLLFVLKLVDGTGTIKIEGVPLLFYSLSFALLSISLIYCLIHSIPKLNSKIGNESNLRTIIGINRFTKIEKAIGRNNFVAREKYYESVIGLSIEDLLKMNITQIAGMSKNNDTSHKTIRKGVIFTIISIAFLIIGTIWLFLQIVDYSQLIQPIYHFGGDHKNLDRLLNYESYRSFRII